MIVGNYNFHVSPISPDSNATECHNYPVVPSPAEPVVHWVEVNDADCIYEDTTGNYDCTDASTMTFHYSALYALSAEGSKLYDDSADYNFTFPYSTGSHFYPGKNVSSDLCQIYNASMSVFIQNPISRPACDPATTDFVSEDIYANGSPDAGYCVCISGYLPTSDPHVCIAHDFSDLGDDFSYTRLSELFIGGSDVQDYNATYKLYDYAEGTPIDAPYEYTMYRFPVENAQQCNDLDPYHELGTSPDYSQNTYSNLSNGFLDSFDRIRTVYKRKYYKFNCYFLQIRSYEGLLNNHLYRFSPSGNTSSGGNDNNATDNTSTGGSTGDSGTSTGGTGESTSSSGGDGGSSTGDTSTGGTGGSTSTGGSSTASGGNNTDLSADLAALSNTNSQGFTNVSDAVNNGSADIVNANLETRDAVNNLADMNKDDVDGDTSYLDNFVNFKDQLLTSVNDVKNNVMDLKATIEGDTYTTDFPSFSNCTITFPVFNSTVSINLCEYAHIFRPYIVFILTVYFLFLLVRLHIYLFTKVYRSNSD